MNTKNTELMKDSEFVMIVSRIIRDCLRIAPKPTTLELLSSIVSQVTCDYVRDTLTMRQANDPNNEQNISNVSADITKTKQSSLSSIPDPSISVDKSENIRISTPAEKAFREEYEKAIIRLQYNIDNYFAKQDKENAQLLAKLKPPGGPDPPVRTTSYIAQPSIPMKSKLFGGSTHSGVDLVATEGDDTKYDQCFREMLNVEGESPAN
jgi:hypothetical protein